MKEREVNTYVMSEDLINEIQEAMKRADVPHGKGLINGIEPSAIYDDKVYVIKGKQKCTKTS